MWARITRPLFPPVCWQAVLLARKQVCRQRVSQASCWHSVAAVLLAGTGDAKLSLEVLRPCLLSNTLFIVSAGLVLPHCPFVIVCIVANCTTSSYLLTSGCSTVTDRLFFQTLAGQQKLLLLFFFAVALLYYSL